MIIPEHDEVNTETDAIMSGLLNEEMRHSFLAIDESSFVDERMLHYNFRPITYTLCSILVIAVPTLFDDLECCTSTLSVNVVHIFYLSLNVLLLLLIIPLYAISVPESIDSIIANGNKSLNRRPPLVAQSRLEALIVGVRRSRTPSKSTYDVHADNAPGAIPERGRSDTEDQVVVTCGSIFYSLDAVYNRFFNVRNTPFDALEDVHFDSRIHDAVPIPFAGVFLLSSNIVLLSAYCICRASEDQALNDMASNLTVLIFFAELIVSYTLFPSISVHFTQIKDEKHPSKRYVDCKQSTKYIESTEQSLQQRTDQSLFQCTSSKIAVYILSAVLSVTLWTTHYVLSGGAWNEEAFYVLLFLLIIYTVICVHLVFRLLVLYRYSQLIVEQFSKALRMRSLAELLVYWDLRRFYIDLVLHSYHSRFQQIWSFLFCALSFSLIVIYFVAKEGDDEGNRRVLPLFVITVFLLLMVLLAVQRTSSTFDVQREHGAMLNMERVQIKQSLCSSSIQRHYHQALIDKSEELCSLIGHMQMVVKDERAYQIGGLVIDNTSSALIRCVCFVFAMVVLSHLI